MSIELLSNELLIECFGYLSSGTLFHAFYGLNQRFNLLLFDHFRTYGFDFRHLSRSDFDAIGQAFILSKPEQITSICLSNNHQAPRQIDYFFEQGFEISKFIHLQTLSIHFLSAGPLAHRIINELQNLPMFSRLIYKPVYSSNNSFCAQRFINDIWRLKKLKYCRLEFRLGIWMHFPVPFMVSSSIEYLILENTQISPNEFIQLSAKTPNLQYLSMHLIFEFPLHNYWQIAPKITKAYIKYDWRSDQLITVLKMLPTLTYLKLNVQSHIIDGYQVEELIRENLPQLKDLHFRMVHSFDDINNKENEIDKILNTFRNPFWIDEHQWFIQCEWNQNDADCVFYTLPYSFEGYHYSGPILLKSTYPIQDKRWLNKTVYSLDYHLSKSDCTALGNIQFYDVTVLSIKVPVHENFWSIMPSLAHVKVLCVSVADDDDGNNQNQLQSILNKMPHLSTFYIHEPPSKVLNLLSFDQKDLSAFFLDLIATDLVYNNEQCIQLSQLPFIIRCKALALSVEDRTCVMHLINALNNLQALTVVCRADNWHGKSLSDDDDGDELVQWFQQQLPSAYILRKQDGSRIITFWIH